MVSFRVSPEVRVLIEQLAARMTIATGRRWTLADVVEHALRQLAKETKED
jgi:DNA-binding GntR family transcriptional regulator